MHFPIIKLEPESLPKEDWDINLDYDDITLNENSDYYGELYSQEERRNVINSEWLKDLLDGIATVDTEKETITFLDKETISNTLHSYYLKVAKELLVGAENKRIKGWNFRNAGRQYRDFDTMFYISCGMTSLDFVEIGIYYPGDTFCIGNIFDAHY